MFLSMLVAWLIPDVPRSLKDCLKREKALLLDLLLSEEVEKQQRRSQSPSNINITINTSEEEPVEMEPDCSIMLQSQTTESELQTADNENLPREEPESTTSEPINPEKDCHSLTTSDPHLNQSVPQSQVKPVGTSHYQTFDLNSPPNRDPRSRARSRCQTLPPRQKGDQPGDSSSRTSHSTSFVHYNQNFPQEISQLLQNTPTAPLQPQSKNPSSKPSSKTELQSEALPCSPSEPEMTSSQQALAQSHSKPELSISQSTALPRPPSRPDLSVSQSVVLPRPPSKPELIGSIAKGLPRQDPATRTKSRCQTLPPRYRGPDTVESSLRTTHSTSFTNINKKSSPLPSDVTHNTHV